MKLITVMTPGLVAMVCWISLLVITFTGCSNTHKERQEAVERSFTNQSVQVKATTYPDQFIVRCEDGSIWEVKVQVEMVAPLIHNYKNCLFDPLYKLPPPLPPLPLEK